jgi:flagellar hook capping protein FlgD
MSLPRISLVVLLLSHLAGPSDASASRESPIPAGDVYTREDCPPVTHYFHVDDFVVVWGMEPGRVPLWGAKSLWCGTGSLVTPGYGNGWDQIFESKNPFSVSGDVHLDFYLTMDTEAGHDQLRVEYALASGGWHTLAAFDGTITFDQDLRVPTTVVLPAGSHAGTVRWRFRFVSDGTTSDEDGFDTLGAVVIDSLVVSDGNGQVTAVEDFEGEAQGGTSTQDWRAALNAPAGFNVVSVPLDQNLDAPVEVTFAEVECEGSTLLSTTTSGPPLPGSFMAGTPTYYNISTTATYLGGITVCISYDENELVVPESALQMLHYDQTLPGWVDVTISLDTDNDIICGSVTSLSPFVIGTGSVTGITPLPIAPTGYALYPNVPNPFNPSTSIAFDVPSGGADVFVAVFDSHGRLVKTLQKGNAVAGRHDVSWNGTDENGKPVTSGVYFCRMSAGSFTQTQKLVLLK